MLGACRICAILLLACLCAATVGCHSSPVILEVQLHPEEKDVLFYRVLLSEPLKAEEYLRWTEADLQRVGHDPVNPYHPTTPIYRLQYAFFAGSLHLASVFYQRDEGTVASPGALRYMRTVVSEDSPPEEGTR